MIGGDQDILGIKVRLVETVKTDKGLKLIRVKTDKRVTLVILA